MRSRIFLDRPFLCPVCRRKVRQLYPLTHYSDKTGHWVAVEACLACCGPAGDDGRGLGGPFRHRAIER